MGKAGAPRGKKTAWLRFAVLAAAALALQGLALPLLTADGDTAVLLYLLHLYAVIPLCALLIPFWAGLGGVHPLAGCFPIGLALLALPVYQSPGMGLLCILLSLVGCVAGQEWIKMRKKRKGAHHG